MRKSFIGGVVLSFLAVFVVSAGLAAAEEKADKAKAKEAEMMEKYAKLAQPGEPHQFIGKRVGKWNAAVKMTMAPGGPAQEAKGTAEFTAVFDGRFVRQDFTGEMMGQPFHGVGYDGYDNFKKQYTGVWMDNMSTSTMVTYGTMDKDGKTVTSFGVMDEPMTGEKNKKVKTVLRWNDDKTFVYEIWDRAGGKEWPAIQITYTRAP